MVTDEGSVFPYARGPGHLLRFVCARLRHPHPEGRKWVVLVLAVRGSRSD